MNPLADLGAGREDMDARGEEIMGDGGVKEQ